MDICFETWNDWEKTNPEFSEAVKRGLVLAQGWWESQGRRGLYQSKDGVNLNPTTWYMNMKNRFRNDWKDRQETDITTQGEKIQSTTFVIGGLPTEDK